MNQIVVSTRQELQRAKEQEVGTIVVTGKLATQLRQGKKLAYAGAGTLVLLGGALAAAPFTGGLSVFGAAPIAALTGLEISAIITASSIGLGLLLAIHKGYEEISFEKGRLTLRKKAS